MSDKIITTHVKPPIPMRTHDWSAHFDGREDGPVGWGSTEAEAISALEIERIFHMTDEECREVGIAEYGSEEAWRAAMDRLRDRMLVSAGGRPAEKPTPDPAVLVEYIDKLTRFYMANPLWIALCEEARGYVGALA